MITHLGEKPAWPTSKFRFVQIGGKQVYGSVAATARKLLSMLDIAGLNFFWCACQNSDQRLLLPWWGTKRLLPKELLWSFVADKFSNYPSLLCTNVDAACCQKSMVKPPNKFQHQNFAQTLQHWQAWQCSMSWTGAAFPVSIWFDGRWRLYSRAPRHSEKHLIYACEACEPLNRSGTLRIDSKCQPSPCWVARLEGRWFCFNTSIEPQNFGRHTGGCALTGGERCICTSINLSTYYIAVDWSNISHISDISGTRLFICVFMYIYVHMYLMYSNIICMYIISTLIKNCPPVPKVSLSHCPTGTMVHRTLLQHQQATELLTWTDLGRPFPTRPWGPFSFAKWRMTRNAVIFPILWSLKPASTYPDFWCIAAKKSCFSWLMALLLRNFLEHGEVSSKGPTPSGTAEHEPRPILWMHAVTFKCHSNRSKPWRTLSSQVFEQFAELCCPLCSTGFVWNWGTQNGGLKNPTDDHHFPGNFDQFWLPPLWN